VCKNVVFSTYTGGIWNPALRSFEIGYRYARDLIRALRVENTPSVPPSSPLPRTGTSSADLPGWSLLLMEFYTARLACPLSCLCCQPLVARFCCSLAAHFAARLAACPCCLLSLQLSPAARFAAQFAAYFCCTQLLLAFVVQFAPHFCCTLYLLDLLLTLLLVDATRACCCFAAHFAAHFAVHFCCSLCCSICCPLLTLAFATLL
jgi:hypothetical protein